MAIFMFNPYYSPMDHTCKSSIYGNFIPSNQQKTTDGSTSRKVLHLFPFLDIQPLLYAKINCHTTLASNENHANSSLENRCNFRLVLNLFGFWKSKRQRAVLLYWEDATIESRKRLLWTLLVQIIERQYCDYQKSERKWEGEPAFGFFFLENSSDSENPFFLFSMFSVFTFPLLCVWFKLVFTFHLH